MGKCHYCNATFEPFGRELHIVENILKGSLEAHWTDACEKCIVDKQLIRIFHCDECLRGNYKEHMQGDTCIDCINAKKEEDRLRNDMTRRKVWIVEDTYGNHIRVCDSEEKANKYVKEECEDEFYVRMYEVF